VDGGVIGGEKRADDRQAAEDVPEFRKIQRLERH
jgi:hypothetical protein